MCGREGIAPVPLLTTPLQWAKIQETDWREGIRNKTVKKRLKMSSFGLDY